MPKGPRDTACLICEQAACVCNRKAAPRWTGRKPVRTVESTLDAPPSAAAQAMREAAARARYNTWLRSLTVQPDRPRLLSDEEYATLAAIRIFAERFELAGPDLKTYRPYLMQPATINERAAAWRFRRREGGGEG